jgi:hypothetical protein
MSINEERVNLHLSTDPRNRHATTRLLGTALAASKIALSEFSEALDREQDI